ncbi:hypothetical protein KF728_22360 [Candidatus Obscuribacterales bacterium]|nr:hypothetical protein [Candidatus Obscuribacterales bacterium]MBX3152920.1 hypothetical protein [Candidatus Obscuribacterales bacterium]
MLVFICISVGGFVLVWCGTTLFVAVDLCAWVARAFPTYFYSSLVALSVVLGLAWNSGFSVIALGALILGLCPIRLFVSRFMKAEDDKLLTLSNYRTLVLSCSVPSGFAAVSCALTGFLILWFRWLPGIHL